MEGHELARRLLDREPNLKVLYLTGYGEWRLREAVTSWEREAVLDKGSSPDAILEAISLLLYNHPPPTGSAM
jgi:DNA-binding NarL/FixJ family response regulator